ncbi:MAG: hypothetical protein P9L99_14800 [Candidatus Lernaella stagnicola]|nr:hypothetical protein [Candidatus Lernaella stagnicola]
MNRTYRLIWLLFAVLLALTLGLLGGCDKNTGDTDNGGPGKAFPRLPADVPLYPTGKIVQRVHDADGAFQVRLITTASPEDIINFYEKRLRPFGWREISRINETPYYLVYKKGSRYVEISVLPTENPEEVLHVLNLGTR